MSETYRCACVRYVWPGEKLPYLCNVFLGSRLVADASCKYCQGHGGVKDANG